MNTLLLTLLLLSPSEVLLSEQVKLQTTETLHVMQNENKAMLKKQITTTLENMELVLPVIVDQQTLAKVQNVKQQLSQD
ncbi:MAG: hypothetical protein ACTH7Q_06395 [Pseudoalteromonas sp.]|uniref:Uncharacterized protein n=1 Tax=Pseudoalteromonas prydzensis TaxID=182141 RepID=A0ABR9FN62_9GAMM|nr:hypothetical protein [Pseudoalteromonas prydzensis]MBE0379996.1 hypothetical protein [Pseudoalteromonas prydzensis ACAM 620]MBE0458263.1 hypothetical protein [Pseudoalteromonas prydzensis]